MCGISGFAGAGDRDILTAMSEPLAHRGPDGEGYFIDAEARVYFGHRRLAVVDIDGGAQPMSNETGSVVVVFNGEIYNHGDLRRQLIERGHRFRSDHSDTEVLVHGYEEWGEELPARLNGMFAFAIYDRRRRRLFLARDRFGEKPLYYALNPGGFAFASELHALRRHPAFRHPLGQKSLQKYFAYGFLPAPNTLFENTFKLAAGSHLRYEVGTAGLSIERYWAFRIEPDHRLTDGDDDRLAEELRHLLEQAVRRRLMADVPLGVFLSGGIDSSSIAAIAARHVAAGQLATFTIGFKEPSFDESAPARRVAAWCQTRHHEEILDLDKAQSLIPHVLARLDEPLGDASILPTYLLSRFTRRHVTVALSGDGGDELFAGYDPFQALAFADVYRKLVPGGLHRLMRALAARLPLSRRNMSFDFKIRRALTGLSYPQAMWNPAWLGPVEPSAMGEFFSAPLPAEELYEEAIALWNGAGDHDLIDRTLEFYTNFYLQDDILTKVDRASMAVSLESRAVFLDNDLVDFCRRLPNRFKYRNGNRKYLLKRAMAGLLPADIIGRRKKGFGIPLSAWLREMPAPEIAEIAGMRPAAIEKCWREHRAGQADHRLVLWSWLSLQQVMAQGGTEAPRTKAA